MTLKIQETKIKGLKIIYLDKYSDDRGSFLKVFNFNYFTECGLQTNFKECYYSVSKKNVLRGMHFQVPPFEHIKLVFLNQGRIKDVILDIRKDSLTYGNYFTTEISQDNPVLLYIPVGCAHGFLSLEDDSIVSYLQTSCYSKESDAGIRWDSFGMNWHIHDPIISQRDISFVTLSDFKSPF
jgi:dTDP-4-dehydrorhamnose 3,5-epimerase